MRLGFSDSSTARPVEHKRSMQHTLVFLPTYEHIKFEILIGPLDTSKLKF